MAAGTEYADARATDPARHDDWQNFFRPATKGWPVRPEEWDLRPYFILEYDLSWREFCDYLRSERLSERAWAVSRVLDGARWRDIWRLVTPADVERVLDRLPKRLRQTWTDGLSAWA